MLFLENILQWGLFGKTRLILKHYNKEGLKLGIKNYNQSKTLVLSNIYVKLMSLEIL